MAITEAQLISWSRPVSTTENEKCSNAISQVTAAIRSKFANSVSIFLQGSYRNNTNVRRDSDVDVVVRHDGYFYHDINRLSDSDKAIYEANRSNNGITFEQLKEDVLTALRDSFGRDAVRKNKCIEVRGNSNRVTADVIPCFVHKRFATLTTIEAKGIQFYTEDNIKIVSFPDQHYENGVEKTNSTARMYKRTVRILKVIRNILVEQGIINENLVSSFFIECLVYNVPNNLFISGNYRQTLKNVISKIYADMQNAEIALNYLEVSRLKWLFRGNSNRNTSDAKMFMQNCWNHVGFE
jgi:hypothetical protein